MIKLSSSVVLLLCIVFCCESVHSWGGRRYRKNYHPKDRAGVEYGESIESTAVKSILNGGGDSVGRFRRQQSSSFGVAGSGGNGLNDNVSTCRVEDNRVMGSWQCDNEEVIHCNGLCNGRTNCADRSDETVASCRQVFCLDSAFRCAYGGCILSGMECDGVPDCADGSDEKTINCPGVVNKIRAQGTCNEGYFQCKSRECIHEDTVCNGNPHCRDYSDETAAVCSTHFCPESGFRCDYGGCVLMISRCDGKRDCFDGSDEKPEMCNTSSSPISPASRQQIPPDDMNTVLPETSPNTFASILMLLLRELLLRQDTQFSELKKDIQQLRLASFGAQTSRLPPTTEKIPQDPPISFLARPVEGVERNDPRDQFTTKRSTLRQPDGTISPPQGPIRAPISFLARPFGGVERNDRLNLGRGPQLLDPFPTTSSTLRQPDGTSPPPQGPIRAPISLLARPFEGVERNDPLEFSRGPQIRDPIPTAPASPPRLPFNTPAPPPLSNGAREAGDCDTPILLGGRVSDKFGRRHSGRFVKNGEELTFECLAGTTLNGINSTYCIDGSLLQPLPLCTNMCATLPLMRLSIQAECFEPTNRTKIPCTTFVPPKTIAILSCRVGYKRPDRNVPDAYLCQDDGHWNSHVYRCIPICGEVTEGRQLIIGGQESNITQVPWHAGIYERIERKIEQICGGSIINPTAIVTAAHCFWDQQRKQMKDPELYGVAVGKTLRDFDADEPTSQKYKVASIKIYDQYMDYEGLFVSDIAVVVLDKPIIFQSYIKPICVEFSLKGNQLYVESGITGRVAGWGLSAFAGEPSPMLKTIDLPTVDFNTCLKESPASFRPFITTDKFCGGFTTGESVCRGDSGGGLAFPKQSEDKGTTVYFLRGIVSVGPIRRGSCDNTKYSAFTDIQLHNPFLYEYVFV